MKNINITVALVFSLLRISYGQKVRASLVKERPPVDSLITHFKKWTITNRPEVDNCLIITLNKSGKSALYSICYADSVHKSTIFWAIDESVKVKTVRAKYFIFKNNLVFILGDEDNAGLFLPTSTKHLFTFKANTISINEILKKRGVGYAFYYQNDRFKLLGDLKNTF